MYSTSSPTKAGNELGELQDDNGGDNSKLKGIVWEGMGLFDSATTEMRRMRNQKKDGSILAQMKITSKEVIPNEIVYNNLGEVQRVKDIYETSPENSPVSSLLFFYRYLLTPDRSLPVRPLRIQLPRSNRYAAHGSQELCH